MAIQRWDPFREAVSLRDAMSSLFEDSFIRPGGRVADGGVAALPLDIAETEGEFIVKASLPGARPEDVQITAQGDTLMIRGETRAEEERKGEAWHMRERRFGSFQRTVSLGMPIDPDKAHASYDHGVLTLRLPKSEGAKPRQIKINGAAQAQAGRETANH